MKQAAYVVTPAVMTYVLRDRSATAFPRGQLRAAIRGYLPTPNDFNLLDVHSDREDQDFIVLVGAEGLPCDGCLLKFDVEFQEDGRRFLYYEEITLPGTPTGRYREMVSVVSARARPPR